MKIRINKNLAIIIIIILFLIGAILLWEIFYGHSSTSPVGINNNSTNSSSTNSNGTPNGNISDTNAQVNVTSDIPNVKIKTFNSDALWDRIAKNGNKVAYYPGVGFQKNVDVQRLHIYLVNTQQPYNLIHLVANINDVTPGAAIPVVSSFNNIYDANTKSLDVDVEISPAITSQEDSVKLSASAWQFILYALTDLTSPITAQDWNTNPSTKRQRDQIEVQNAQYMKTHPYLSQIILEKQ